MSEYILTYHGGRKPDSPEEGAQHMAAWRAWAEDLGDAVVNRGTPLGSAKVVNAEGGNDKAAGQSMSGFSVVTADDIDAAVAMARKCPFIDLDGTLEVAEMKQM